MELLSLGNSTTQSYSSVADCLGNYELMLTGGKLKFANGQKSTLWGNQDRFSSGYVAVGVWWRDILKLWHSGTSVAV